MAGSASGAKPERTVPAEVRDRAEVPELQRFGKWLDRHTADCAAQVTTWMVSALPVPTGLPAQVRPDEAWRTALRDVVVVGDGPGEVGLLRGADPADGLRLVNRDGGTVSVTAPTVTVSHPVLLPDLEGLWTSAAGLGVLQGVEQLHRATWCKPAAITERDYGVTEFAEAEYRSWLHLVSRATSLGYKVSGSSVVDRIRDVGRVFTASVAMSDPYTEDKAWTGSLDWYDKDGQRRLPLSDVGPVAWPEGMRMTAALHAGRTTTTDGAE